mgnify:CR=1 FL=1
MSKASKNTSHRKLFTVSSDAPFQFVEAYKSLRTNLEFLSSAGNCKTILITPPPFPKKARPTWPSTWP